MSLDRFLHERVHWSIARYYYKALGKLRRLDRMIRYRSIPKGGWGQGWRTLIFRYRKNNRRQLLVLAPVDGDKFDYVLWNSHVRQNDWPDIMPRDDYDVGVLEGAGHHAYVILADRGPKRLGMGKLVPGEFGGGTDVSFVLIDVRSAKEHMMQGARAGAKTEE